MAKKKNSRTLKEVGARNEIKRLWKMIPVQEWINLFREIAPENMWEMEGHSSIKGKCPYHEDGDPSFHLSFQKSMGKCFGDVCGKVVVDLVSLVARLRRSNYTEAILFLNDRFDLNGRLLANADELNAYNNTQELKKQVAIASNKILIDLIRDDPDYLDYCRPALSYLLDSRNLPRETLHLLPVGVFAKPEHVKRYIDDPTLYTAYDEYFKRYQTPAFWGSLIFYYNDSPGSISRFKLRLINEKVVPSHPTKDNLSSLNPHERRQLFKREFAYIEDPYTSSLGVYGLWKYRHMIGRNDANAYLTEGEFDVLSVMAAQDMNLSSELMILGTGGRGGTNVGFLREFGVRTVWMVSDHPSKAGDNWTLAILADRSNFQSDETFRPLEMKIFQWPVSIKGNDLDEAVQKTGYIDLVDFLVRKRNEFFLNSVPWISQKCDQELYGVKRKFDAQLYDLNGTDKEIITQRENILDERKRVVKDVLLKWYRYLHDSSDQLNFSQKYEVAENINLAQLDEIYKRVGGLDNYQGVCDLIAKALEEYFSVGFYEGQGPGMRMTLWSKKRGSIFEVLGDENKMMQQLSLHLGSHPLKWLDKLLGNNIVYTGGTEKATPEKVQKIKQANATGLLRYAINDSWIPKMVKKSDLTVRDQGIHFYDLPPSMQNEKYCYFCNGKFVFRGQFTEPGQMEWERVNNVVDIVGNDGVMFSGVTSGHQWSHVKDVSDLYAASHVDLKDVYEKIVTILRGWKFEHHEVVEKYLAVYIMSLPIMCAVGNVSITLVTGGSESGKTSLVNGLIGGTQTGGANHIQPIVESALALNDCTPAAMYQTFDCSALTFILDEAEKWTTSGKTNDHFERLTQLTYGMPMNAVPVKRGGISKDGQTLYMMRMPMVMAAINIPTDTTFINRTFVVSTVKDKNRKDLSVYISENFSDTQIEDLRRAITIGLIPHIPQLMQIYRKLKTDLEHVSVTTTGKSNRFDSLIRTPLAVYEMLGFSASDLYQEILENYGARLESLDSQQDQNSLIDNCLYKKVIRVVMDGNVSDYTSPKALIEDKNYAFLNSTRCGVYYLEEKDWIIFVWRQAKYGILPHTKFETVDESGLKEYVAKNPYVVHSIKKDQHNFIQYHLGLSDVSGPSDYSVVRADYLIKYLNDSKDQKTFGQDFLSEKKDNVIKGKFCF